MTSMTNRERFQATMHFQPVDRLPMIEWATWWTETIDRWHKEGLPPWGPFDDDGVEIMRHLGLDVHRQDWLWPRDPAHRFPENDDYGKGFNINSMDDYEAFKPYLYPADAVNKTKWQAWAKEQAQGDSVLWFTLDGFFWHPRILMGIEQHLYAFYDEPELMHRMNEDNVQYMLKMIDDVLEVCTPDFMTFAEDMSYNNGPMLSKDHFDEFIKPYYDRIIPRLKDAGIITIIDSDGDMTEAANWFEEAGLDGILPLERQAGVDMAQLRRDHPKQLYIGGFDKMVMSRGEKAMRAEFERLVPVAKEGGYIISCDHQTPPGVSLEDYKLYLKLFREYGTGS